MRMAALAATMSALVLLAPRGVRWTAAPASAATSTVDAPRALAANGCGDDELPDHGVCVRVAEENDFSSGEPTSNTHHDRAGRLVEYQQIPRRSDRPADYDAYRYPIPPGLLGGHAVASGYDLDAPDHAQRRGRTLRAVGHGGVDLPQARGTPVRAVVLDHQQGDAEVVYVGALFGTTVITVHTLREAGGHRDHILIHGHLDHAAQGLARGTRVRDGDVLGAVGDTGSPELVHLHLEARRMRDGRDARAIASGSALLDESIPVDPRNVLPLR